MRWVTVFLLLVAVAQGADKPKYGPSAKPVATPLSADSAYFRSGKAAPDFWNLIGYYVPQQNGYSCSAASVTMILNAALATKKKTAADENIRQTQLLDAVDADHWKARVNPGGFKGDYGLNLEQLGKAVQASFEKYLKGVTVKVRHADATPAFRAELLKALGENEASAQNFILANFDQKVFTDDTPAGHIAPVGAYDAKAQRVLILDPDRDFYEPYWVSVENFIAGMNTVDKGANATRGYVSVTFQKP